MSMRSLRWLGAMMSLSQILKERSESKSQKSNALCRLTSSLALISFGEKGFAGSRKRRKNLIISFELAEWLCLTDS